MNVSRNARSQCGSEPRGAAHRARHAARLGRRLLEPREQRREVVGRAHAVGRAAARVQPPALARLADRRPRGVDLVLDVARALDPLLGVVLRAALAQPLGHVGEQRADPVVDPVDAPRRGAVVQRRPDEQVDREPDGDPDHRVEQPGEQHRGVARVARQQHHERRGRRGRGLRAQAAGGARQHAHEQHDAQRRGVDAERRAGGERQQHAQHRGADLLGAARQRPVHGRVHGQQRRPRRQERLRDAEHVAGDHPRDHGRRDRLDDLRRVGPQHRVPEPLAY